VVVWKGCSIGWQGAKGGKSHADQGRDTCLSMATPVSREPTGEAKSWPVPGLKVSVAISPACWRSTQETNRGVQGAVMKGLMTLVG
jgi:hypothetical protein